MKTLKMYFARLFLWILSFRKIKSYFLLLLKKFPLIESLLLRLYYLKHKTRANRKDGTLNLDGDAMDIYIMLKMRIKNEEHTI